MFPNIPSEYLREPGSVPGFWLSTVDEVERFLKESVREGQLITIGRSAGGRPIHAVCYGDPRGEQGTTTFSGAVGVRDVRAFFGPGHAKKVFMVMAAVHGGEFEGIVGTVNLLSVLENGKDLRGKPWPDIVAAASAIDRIVVVPIVNVDGRARIGLRMEAYQGTDDGLHEYFNTGCWKDGTRIGWPACKLFIPLDFLLTQFPGGYPNDAGVNIQHDDFFGARQPETQALLDLTARERPDLIFNMHTGAPPRNYYMRMHRPLIEPVLGSTFEALYRAVHTRLAEEGLQGTRDPAIEGDPAQAPAGVYNLDTALNLHTGALCTVIEAPSHGFAGRNRDGEVVCQTPDMILDAHLVTFLAGLQFLSDNGGRCQWTSKG